MIAINGGLFILLLVSKIVYSDFVINGEEEVDIHSEIDLSQLEIEDSNLRLSRADRRVWAKKYLSDFFPDRNEKINRRQLMNLLIMNEFHVGNLWIIRLKSGPILSKFVQSWQEIGEAEREHWKSSKLSRRIHGTNIRNFS
jgi:hypothetical protein